MRENPVFSRVLMKSDKEKTVEKIKGKIVGPIIHCSPVLTRVELCRVLYKFAKI